MGMTIEPNYFVEVFRCCEDCKMYESCINVGYGCCSYKLYEKKVVENGIDTTNTGNH